MNKGSLLPQCSAHSSHSGPLPLAQHREQRPGLSLWSNLKYFQFHILGPRVGHGPAKEVF